MQKVAYLHSSLRLQQLLPELRTKLPAGSKALMVTPCWLKIVPEWLNKGAALTKVMRECGIRPEEAAAFGDGENDLGMLKSVTHGYAMGSKNSPGKIPVRQTPHRSAVSVFNGRSGVLLFQIRSAGRLTARAGERPLLSC